MLAWSSLLVQKIHLQVAGLSLRKLQVNRHRIAEVRTHAHEHGQVILYLSGEGGQLVGDRHFPARTGDLFVIPVGCVHGFVPAGKARPICLVIDFDRTGHPDKGQVIRRSLEPSALNSLHELISRLPRKGGLRLSDYATVTAAVALLFDPRSTKRTTTTENEPVFDRVRRLLLDPDGANLSLADISTRVGYQPDYLSRKLRRECGKGLRELRDSLRLELATTALRSGASVADAAQRAGFGDPAYFARWFRQQTRSTPREYRGRERAR